VLRHGAGEVEISVTDTGPGVPEADRARVIERFVRLESSRNQPGAGLGLPLVAAVISAHAGRLQLGDGDGSLGGQGLSVAMMLAAGT
jgi:signal transduction histidine kinase